MPPAEDKDTRYFIDVDMQSMKVVHHGFDQRERLDKGRQIDPSRHRLFLTRGQYHQSVERCIGKVRAAGPAHRRGRS